MNKMLSGKAIRRTLKDWDQIKALGAHPLSNLDVVRTHRQAVGYSDTPTGRGLALREVLLEAIKALKPEDGRPRTREKRWRPYIILNEQYLNGRRPDWVASQLYISRRTYYHEQRRALEIIADTLCKWEEQRGFRTFSPTRAEARSVSFQIPFLAPPQPAHKLVGRDALLDRVGERLLSGQNQNLIALTGLPGVGKTAVAIELAHNPRILEHFSDGVLWAGLGCQPDVLTLLGRWARAVGLPQNEIARRTDPTERAAAIHAAIGMRRMLLVVDDAWQIEEALAFKVGGPNCGHVLTTRLISVALDFAGQGSLEVHELGADEGLDLLSQLAARVVQAESQEARNLVQSVGGLPLALILVGRHLQRQSFCAPPRRLHQALAQLRATETRLQLEKPQSPLERHPNLPLDTPMSLKAAIGISEQALEAPARHALYSLALLPSKPNSFSEEAALAIADVSPHVLDTLVDHGLLEILERGRYTLHQTVADYARLWADETAARERMVAYFVTYARQHVDEHEQLEQELAYILNALETAFEHGMARELIDGSIAMHPFLLTRGLYDADERHLRRAYETAKDKDDQVSLAKLSHNLGIIAIDRGRFVEARQYLEQGLSLARVADLSQLEADILRGLGNLFADRGDYATAKEVYRQALDLSEQIGDPKGKSSVLNNLGIILEDQGDFDQARTLYEQALVVFDDLDDPEGQGLVLNNLGNLATAQGDLSSARACYEQALEVNRRAGVRSSEGLILCNLGFLFLQVGQYAAAQVRLEEGLAIFRQIGARRLESWNLCYLSMLWHYQGDDEAAREYSQLALQIARQLDDPIVQPHALTFLGHAYKGLGQLEKAADLYRQALDRWQEMAWPHFVTSSRADLARVCLAQGDLSQARALVQEILDGLAHHSLEGTLEPFRVYLVCYRVLRASQDPRAQAVLETAQDFVRERAEKIDDAELRRSFLENVPHHREILGMAASDDVDK